MQCPPCKALEIPVHISGAVTIYFLDSWSDLLTFPNSYYIELSPCDCWYRMTILSQAYPLSNLEIILLVLLDPSLSHPKYSSIANNAVSCTQKVTMYAQLRAHWAAEEHIELQKGTLSWRRAHWVAFMCSWCASISTEDINAYHLIHLTSVAHFVMLVHTKTPTVYACEGDSPSIH